MYELIYRTSSYASWQTEHWLSHCDDYCMFIDYVGWEEIKELADELKDDIEKIKLEYQLTQEELEKWLFKGGTLQGYLFKCTRSK
ncbi:CbrC family protein [Mycoplasmatota bacterium]|nr:CbrC family protein [Mycoplasmatota bacterium]